MPFTPTDWIDNVTAADAQHLNNTDSQYTEATNSFCQDLFTPFVLWGLTCAKDGTTASQLDADYGVYYALQADLTLRRRYLAAANYTTSVASTTYYLDANPDGTVSWGTAHSTEANYLTICQVTTDVNANILTVTDERSLDTGLLFANNGLLALPALANTTVTGIAVPGAPTLALAAGSNLGIGVYDYAVSWVTHDGAGSLIGTPATITTTSANQAITLTNVPLGPSGIVVNRNIYRTKVGGGAYYLLVTLYDNTTTTVNDTTPDANLSAIQPLSHPTLGGSVYQTSGAGLLAAIYGDGAVVFDSGDIATNGSGLLSIHPTAAYDALNIVSKSGSSYSCLIGYGDTTYFAGAGVYCYDSAGTGGFVWQNGTKSGITFNGTMRFVGTASNSGLLQIVNTESGGHTWDIFVRTAGIGNDNALSFYDTTSNVTVSIDTAGNLIGTAGSGIPTTRNGAGTSVPIYTGANSPSNPPTGSIWVKA